MKLYEKPHPQTDVTHPSLTMSEKYQSTTKYYLRKFKIEPFTSNLNTFKLPKAKARKTIKQAKKISWQNCVNKLNSSTKTNSVWQKPVYSSQTPH